MKQKRNFHDWLDAFLEYTDNSESPFKYRQWVGISALASVLERKCYFNWDKRQYLNMYIVIIGPSGVRKGTAITPAQRLLKEVGIKLSAESITREALIRELNKSKQDRLPDGTIKTHSSLTILSPELTVFLGYQNNQLMMDLTDWFDSPDDWTYRIKNGPSDEIKGVWINFLGATTPKMLKASLNTDAIGGGLTSRIIFVFEKDRGKRVLFPFSKINNGDDKEMLIDDLVTIKMNQGEFMFTEDFLNAYAEWFHESQEVFEEKHKGSPLEAYATRRQIHHIKLSCILNISRNGEMVVTGEDFKRSAKILEETEINMPMTFSGVGESPEALVLSRIIGFISYRKEVTIREIFKKFQFDAATDRLIAMVKSIKYAGAIEINYPENDRDNWQIKWIKENKDE